MFSDLKQAIRSMVKAPGFSITTIATLALGIGAATAIFSVVHALLMAPLQYHDSNQLVQVQAVHPKQGNSGLAPATFADLASTSSFEHIAAQYYYYVNLTGSETPALINSGEVTGDF